MRRTFSIALSLLIGLAALVGVTSPAHAYPNPVNPWHMPTHYPCVNDHTGAGSQWPVATAASEWGRMSADLNFAFDYDLVNGCDGWSEATTIDVFYYQGSDPAECGVPSVVWDPLTYATTGVNLWINLNGSTYCKGTSIARANTISQLIGYAIGLDYHHNGSRSVMSDTVWSTTNVPYAQIIDGQTADDHQP